MPVAAAIGAAGSLLGGIFSSSMSAKNQKYAIEVQKQENAKNRAFNAEQARLARAYNTSMWNAQNDYNDPSAVQQRLSRAGIHPALAYTDGQTMGSLSMGNTGAQGSYSTGLSVPPADFSGIRDAANNAASALDTISHSSVNTATAGLTDKQRSYYDQLAEGKIALQQADITLKTDVSNLTKENRRLIATQADEIEQRISIIDEFGREMARDQAAIVKFEADLKRFIHNDEWNWGAYATANLNKSLAESTITTEQAYLARRLATAEVLYKTALAASSSGDARLKNALADIEEYRYNTYMRLKEEYPDLVVSSDKDHEASANSLNFNVDNFWKTQWFGVFKGSVDKAGDMVVARYGKHPQPTSTSRHNYNHNFYYNK